MQPMTVNAMATSLIPEESEEATYTVGAGVGDLVGEAVELYVAPEVVTEVLETVFIEL